jgi:hypothetical protein
MTRNTNRRTSRCPTRVCFGSKNSFARGPASSNVMRGSKTDFDPLGDAHIVANRVTARGSEAQFAECVCSSEEDDREHLRGEDA